MMKELGYVHPISIWDENSIRCCHLESHLFLMCCMDGLAFPSEDILLFNMILYSLYLFRYVDKLPWNWISDFGAPLVPLQHADTNSNPIFIDICRIFYSHYLQIFNPWTLFAAKKDPTEFPLP